MSKVGRLRAQVSHRTDHNTPSQVGELADRQDTLDEITPETREYDFSIRTLNAPRLRNSESSKKITGLADKHLIEPISIAELNNFIQTIHDDGKKIIIYIQDIVRILEAIERDPMFWNLVQSHCSPTQIHFNCWGLLKYILEQASAYPGTLQSVLNIFETFVNYISCPGHLVQLSMSDPLHREVLRTLYEYIIDFQIEIILCFQWPTCELLINASLKSLTSSMTNIRDNLMSYRMLIRICLQESSNDSLSLDVLRGLAVPSSIQTLISSLSFEENRSRHRKSEQNGVQNWLKPFDNESEQDKHRQTRSICHNPGLWLLNNSTFMKWSRPIKGNDTLLWLYGIPGAGKTILASVVVDSTRQIPGATVLFSYCKQSDDARNSFLALARSILAQILVQHPRLLPLLYEKSQTHQFEVLSTDEIAKDTMMMCFECCENTCVVIDGLEDCPRHERAYICDWLQSVSNKSSPDNKVSVRFLIISQDDEIIRKSLATFPNIKITNEQCNDIEEYAGQRTRDILQKFGELSTEKGTDKYNIAERISTKAQGMFVVAEEFANHLLNQTTHTALVAELDSNSLPVTLDHMYDKIIERIYEPTRNLRSLNDYFKFLGWIMCAKRPLKWQEIQAASYVNLDTNEAKLDPQKKIVVSPQERFGPLIQMDSDSTVRLAHETAREFLVRKEIVDLNKAHYSMATLCVEYLIFPIEECDPVKDISIEDFDGFHDYASSYWAWHLVYGGLHLRSQKEIQLIVENLGTLLQLHFPVIEKSDGVPEKIKEFLAPLQRFNADTYDKICHIATEFASKWDKKDDEKDQNQW